MRTASRLLLFIFICFMPLAACQLGFGYDKEQFITELRAEGVKVDYTAMMAPNIWLGTGQTILVNDERVHLYEFPDSRAAAEKAATIGPEGASIDVPYLDTDDNLQVVLHERLAWNGDPHLYQRGQLIVVYVGDDPTLIQLLSEVLGEPFAGSALAPGAPTQDYPYPSIPASTLVPYPEMKATIPTLFWDTPTPSATHTTRHSPTPTVTFSLAYNDSPFSLICLRMTNQRSANLWRIEVGEDEEQQLTYETEGWWITSYDISPKGDRIAYTPYKGAGADALIKLVELYDNTLTVITGENDPGLEDDVVWLDDHRITYRLTGSAKEHEVKGSAEWQAYWHGIDLYHSFVLDLNSDERSHYPEYTYITQSPDNSYWLTCQAEHFEAPCEYRLHNLDSHQQWPIAENVGWGQFIAWAPDGQDLLFNSYQRTDSAIHLVVVDRETRQAHTITPENQVVTSASWSPDGQRNAYSLCDKQQNCSLWVINREGDQPQQIYLDLPVRAYNLDWSPDGSRLVFALDPDKADLWSVRIDGTDLRPIASDVVDCRVLPGK